MLASRCLALQRENQNNNAFDSVYTFQDLDVPDAQRIRGLENLLGASARRIPPCLQSSADTTERACPDQDFLCCKAKNTVYTTNMMPEQLLDSASMAQPNAGRHLMSRDLPPVFSSKTSALYCLHTQATSLMSRLAARALQTLNSYTMPYGLPVSCFQEPAVKLASAS